MVYRVKEIIGFLMLDDFIIGQGVSENVTGGREGGIGSGGPEPVDGVESGGKKGRGGTHPLA